MRSQDEDVVKRDAEATRYLNESDERTSKQSFEEDLDELEEHRFEVEEEQEQEQEEKEDEKQQSEEEEEEEEDDFDTQQMVAEDKESEPSDADVDVQETVEYDQDAEQQLSGSSSGSWESGDEDDDGRQGGIVAVLRETTTEIPVSRLSVVTDADKRQQQQQLPTKTSLRGQR